MDEGLERLTEKQRDVLRLVARGQTSKQIAKALGLSPHTGDYHARGAIEAMGVATRMEAAQLLAAAEQGADYQPLIGTPLIVADPTERAPSSERDQMPVLPWWMALLVAFTGGTRTNELSGSQRAIRILILVAAILTAVGLFLLGVTAINGAAYRLPV